MYIYSYQRCVFDIKLSYFKFLSLTARTKANRLYAICICICINNRQASTRSINSDGSRLCSMGAELGAEFLWGRGFDHRCRQLEIIPLRHSTNGERVLKFGTFCSWSSESKSIRLSGPGFADDLRYSKLISRHCHMIIKDFVEEG